MARLVPAVLVARLGLAALGVLVFLAGPPPASPRPGSNRSRRPGQEWAFQVGPPGLPRRACRLHLLWDDARRLGDLALDLVQRRPDVGDGLADGARVRGLGGPDGF